MCKELDYAEQLDSNLTVLSKDKWIKAHIDEECNQEETEGKNKKQKEYDVTVYINRVSVVHIFQTQIFLSIGLIPR